MRKILRKFTRFFAIILAIKEKSYFILNKSTLRVFMVSGIIIKVNDYPASHSNRLSFTGWENSKIQSPG